jgi:hypothetical protein
MTAYRSASVSLPSAALALLMLACPSDAGAAGRLEEDDVVASTQEQRQDDQGRGEERRRANDGDWFRAPMQGAGGPEDFPSGEIREAVVANANAATARAVYRRTESALHATVRAQVRDFESSPELREALAAEQRAYESLQEARRTALRDVTDDPKYQAMQDLRQNLSQRLADCRDSVSVGATTRLVTTDESPRCSPEELLAIATLKMRVGSEARGMERDVLADNEQVKKARADLAAAGERVATLRADFDRKLRENGDLKAVRDALEDARIARVTAETYLHGASLAAKEALDFAYYLHRYDYYRYRSPYYNYYNTYPYGYGASYGYGSFRNVNRVR